MANRAIIEVPSGQSLLAAAAVPPPVSITRSGRPQVVLVVALALAYAAAGIAYGLYSLTLPTDGWLMGIRSAANGSPLVYERQVTGADSPIESDDVLIAVEGRPVAEMMGAWLSGQIQRPPTWGVGQTAHYVISRAGADVALEVKLDRRGLETVLRTAARAWTAVLALMVFAIVGTFVFIRVPYHPAAKPMLILAATEIVGLTVHEPIVGAATPSEMFDPIGGTARLILSLSFYGFYCSFWLHLFLTFPEVKLPLRTRPVLTLVLVYAGPFLIEVGAWAASLRAPTQFHDYLQVSLVIDILIVLGVVLACLIHSFRTIHDPVRRAQLRWLVFALVIAFPVSSLLGLANNLWLGADPVIAAILIVASSTLFPLAIAIAIVRYRLFDIDALINRALVYGCLTFLVGATYFSSLALLQAIVRSLTGQNSDWALVGSTIVSVSLINPLRMRVQTVVDRRFYRTKYDAAKTLSSFGASLREKIDLTALCNELVAVVRETMQPASVRLWLPAAAGSPQLAAVTRDVAEQPPVVEMPDPFLEIQQVAGMETLRELADRSPIARSLREDGAVLAVPLITRGELIGLLSLGHRRSGQDYTVDDRLLLDSLADQAAPAVRVAQLVAQQQKAEIARAAVDQELRLARDIQRSLLPQTLPSAAGWRTTAHYQPAREVGGDFYDFIHLSDDRLGFVIGDVANKGMPAALVMASVRTMIRAIAHSTTAPSEILSRVNDQLLPDLPGTMFVTCLVVVLDAVTGELSLATAGHPPPLQRTAHGVYELSATGLPLGFAPGAEYDEHRGHVQPGEVLLAYTDGLLEGRNETGELFGLKRVTDVVQGRDGSEPERLLPALLDAFGGFVGSGDALEDDVTLVAVQRLRVPASVE